MWNWEREWAIAGASKDDSESILMFALIPILVFLFVLVLLLVWVNVKDEGEKASTVKARGTSSKC